MTKTDIAKETSTPITTRNDEVPFCRNRLGNDPTPVLALNPSDNGRVISIYVGQVFELDFGDGALTSSVGGTLCAAGDSGTPTGPDDEDIAIGDYDYGAIGKGTDFVALPQSGGGKAVFEVSIISAPASGLSAAQIALRGIGLLLVIAGIFLRIRESTWWKRRSATAVKGR
jgi:hypothetical protein